MRRGLVVLAALAAGLAGVAMSGCTATSGSPDSRASATPTVAPPRMTPPPTVVGVIDPAYPLPKNWQALYDRQRKQVVAALGGASDGVAIKAPPTGTTVRMMNVQWWQVRTSSSASVILGFWSTCRISGTAATAYVVNPAKLVNGHSLLRYQSDSYSGGCPSGTLYLDGDQQRSLPNVRYISADEAKSPQGKAAGTRAQIEQRGYLTPGDNPHLLVVWANPWAVLAEMSIGGGWQYDLTVAEGLATEQSAQTCLNLLAGQLRQGHNIDLSSKRKPGTCT